MKSKQKKKASNTVNTQVTKRSSQLIRNMTKDELREQLKHLSLKTTGKRNELIKRLEQAENLKVSSKSSESMSSSKIKRRSTGNAKEEVKQNGSSNTQNIPSELKMLEQKERESLVLWKHPFKTFYYFLLELLTDIHNYGKKLMKHKVAVLLLIIIFAIGVVLYNSHGSEFEFIRYIEKKMLWCMYWVGLGILSSVGLGTGLHTFLLYLGPHIASVTLAAYECQSLNFPEPPYPDEIVCPEDSSADVAMSIWKIMSKVRLEAFMWGAGTALGELPPYFMAKAARMSGNDVDDEELQEFEELLQHERDSNQSFLDRAKLTVEKLVERVGFFGILACASIPNPLFDLAGITCGHFLVPFWTFFGATLIGKAVIKMHIQKLFVIIAFNEHHVEQVVEILRYIPYVGVQLQAPFKELLAKQKASLHRKTSPSQSGSWLSWVFEKFVILMIIYFVLSIVNSMAQSYHKRLCKKSHQSQPQSKVH